MQRSVTFLASFGLALAALAPLASAQDTTITTAAVTVTAPAGPTPVEAGTNHTVGFDVAVEAEGFLCPQASSFSIALAATGNPAGVTLTLANTSLAFPIAAATPYSSSSKYTHSEQVQVTVTAEPTAPDAEFAINFTATLAQNAQGCLPQTPGDDASAEHAIAIEAAAPPEDGEENGEEPPPNGNVTDNETPKKKDKGFLPGPQAPLLVLAFLAAAAVLGRRRRAA